MGEAADVKSLTGLVDWHAALANFRHEATECLASINMEIQRASDYLEDQDRFWRNRMRDAEEEVVAAKADLNKRQMPDFSGRMPDCSVQEEALREAEDKMEYAQEQIRVVRRWQIHLPREINEAYEGVARRYSSFLEGETQRSLNLLQNQIRAIEAYLQLEGEKQ